MTAIWTRDSGMTVYELANQGAYKNQLPYPTRVGEPEVLRKRAKELTAEEIVGLQSVIFQYEQDKAACEVARRLYTENEGKMNAQFRADLEAEHGMTGHAKADMLWSKAWENGHSAGLTEVALVYDDLVELVR